VPSAALPPLPRGSDPVCARYTSRESGTGDEDNDADATDLAADELHSRLRGRAATMLSYLGGAVHSRTLQSAAKVWLGDADVTALQCRRIHTVASSP
jgi:hypothetical protein